MVLIGVVRRIGLTVDENIVERHATTLDAKLDGYEAILSRQKYLAGDVSVRVVLQYYITILMRSCRKLHSLIFTTPILALSLLGWDTTGSKTRPRGQTLLGEWHYVRRFSLTLLTVIF